MRNHGCWLAIIMCWRVRNVKRYRLNPTNWQLESICQTLYTQQVWSIWIVKKNLPGNVKRLHFHQLFMTLLYNTFCDTGVPRKNMWKCLGDNGKSGGNTQEDLFTEMRVFFLTYAIQFFFEKRDYHLQTCHNSHAFARSWVLKGLVPINFRW